MQVIEGLPSRFNLRDLGSLRTGEGRNLRPGRLFRGASLHRLEPEDSAALAALGLRTAIDLRSSREVGYGAYSHDSVSTHNFPVFERSPTFPDPVEDVVHTLAEAYLWLLDEGPGAFRAGLALLADADSYPAVVYCAAGKDRTGVFCALVLELVGVERDQIAADYALSEEPTQALREWRASLAPDRRDPVPADIYRAPEEAMLTFLDRVDSRFGSVPRYLESIGVPVAETRAALRRHLLAPAERR